MAYQNLRHLKSGQRAIVKYRISPVRTVEIECSLKWAQSDRVALTYPEDMLDYASYLEEGIEFDLTLYTDHGVKNIESIVLDSPFDTDFVVDYYEKPDKNIQRREYLRVDAQVQIYLFTEGDSYKTKTINIGGGGIRFVTDREFQDGSIWDVSLSLNNNDAPLRAQGKIVRTVLDAEQPFGIVEFTEISEFVRSKIMKFCMHEDAKKYSDF